MVKVGLVSRPCSLIRSPMEQSEETLRHQWNLCRSTAFCVLIILTSSSLYVTWGHDDLLWCLELPVAPEELRLYTHTFTVPPLVESSQYSPFACGHCTRDHDP